MNPRCVLLLLLAAPVFAQPAPVIGLSANGSSVGRVLPGGVLVLHARLLSVSGQPIVLKAADGEWTQGLAPKILARDGSAQEWNLRRASTVEPEVTLDLQQSLQLFFVLSPEDAANLARDSFTLSLELDMSQRAAPGSWNGKVSSNSVRVSFEPETPTPTPEQDSLHWLTLSFYHELTSNPEAALQAVGSLLEKQPDNLPGWVRRGDLFAGAGRIEEAGEAYDTALDLFQKQNPEATHTPAGILRKLNALRSY